MAFFESIELESNMLAFFTSRSSYYAGIYKEIPFKACAHYSLKLQSLKNHLRDNDGQNNDGTRTSMHLIDSTLRDTLKGLVGQPLNLLVELKRNVAGSLCFQVE